eukprot:TRINITY_DN60732_c0_g1_i1.p1 TRINITY_DN60732_c0_g1~~TRINITY_DN60732_c0_g1_i1.p1  ORF type:complete len:683 (-),score=153.87 TRINITY_DN60732_c0_g1_i1:58-2106(-)
MGAGASAASDHGTQSAQGPDAEACSIRSLLASLHEAQGEVSHLKNGLESFRNVSEQRAAASSRLLSAVLAAGQAADSTEVVEVKELPLTSQKDGSKLQQADKDSGRPKKARFETPEQSTAETPEPSVETTGTPRQLVPRLKLPAPEVRRQKPAEQDFSALTGGRRPIRIAKAEFRGMQTRQLVNLIEFLGNRANRDGTMAGWYTKEKAKLDMEYLNLHELMEWVILPITDPHGCSYVEAVSQEHHSQPAAWFVSHYWGDSVLHFTTCIEKHREVRELSARTPYWVCAYCLSSKELAEDADALSTFLKVIASSRGTLLVLGEEGAPFKRLWCLAETFMSSGRGPGQRRPLLLDLAAVGDEGAALITDGPTEEESEMMADWSSWKRRREQTFPFQTLQGCLQVRVTEAAVSRESDRPLILSTLLGCSADQAGKPLSEGNSSCDVADHCLSSTMAITLWPYYLRASMDVRPLCQALSQDTTRQFLDLPNLGLDLQGHQDQQEQFDLLAASLRPLKKLLWLKVSFENCQQLQNIRELVASLSAMRDLKVLVLKFNGCTGLGSVAELGSVLPTLTTLVELEVDLAGCSGLCKLESLWKAWAVIGRLQTLRLNLQDCTGLESVSTLARALGSLQNLEDLCLQLQGCTALPELLRKCYSPGALGRDPRKQFLWEVARCANAERAGKPLK